MASPVSSNDGISLWCRFDLFEMQNNMVVNGSEEGFEADEDRSDGIGRESPSQRDLVLNTGQRALLLRVARRADDSRDLDQLSLGESTAGSGAKISVAVADVSASVVPGSALDRHAHTNTTSVYTPPRNFPMLPDRIWLTRNESARWSPDYGMLISAFARTQIAALFGTAILTVLPATIFGGMQVPVSALSGMARIMGRLFPMTYFLPVSVGTFTKGLGFFDLAPKLAALAIFAPALTRS